MLMIWIRTWIRCWKLSIELPKMTHQHFAMFLRPSVTETSYIIKSRLKDFSPSYLLNKNYINNDNDDDNINNYNLNNDNKNNIDNHHNNTNI